MKKFEFGLTPQLLSLLYSLDIDVSADADVDISIDDIGGREICVSMHGDKATILAKEWIRVAYICLLCKGTEARNGFTYSALDFLFDIMKNAKELIDFNTVKEEGE